MAKPRPCPECADGIIKNFKAVHCWNCYNTKYRQKPSPNFSTGFGEKHPNWTGGGWLYWRKQTLLRDNYTCQHCGLRDEKIMDIDHIIPLRMTLKGRRDFEKMKQAKESAMSNLQALCPNCHKRKSNKEAKFHTAHLKSR